MKLSLTLDYTIGEGWLQPWVEGLRQGKAMASSCSTCGQLRFPPVRICPICRVASGGWAQLDGRATVEFRTIGTDGDFALARFDGATGAALVCAEALPEHSKRGRLRAVPDGPPAIILGPETTP